MKLSTKTLIGLGLVGAAAVAAKAYKSAKNIIDSEIMTRNFMYDHLPDAFTDKIDSLFDQSGKCEACSLKDKCDCKCDRDEFKTHLIALSDNFQLIAKTCECGLSDCDCEGYTLVVVDNREGLKSTLDELRNDNIFDLGMPKEPKNGVKTSVNSIENSVLVELTASTLEEIQLTLMSRLEKEIVDTHNDSKDASFIDKHPELASAQAFIALDNTPDAIFEALCNLRDSGLVPRQITLDKSDLKRLEKLFDNRDSEIFGSRYLKICGTVTEIHEKLVYLFNIVYQLGQVDENGSLNFDIDKTQEMIDQFQNFVNNLSNGGSLSDLMDCYDNPIHGDSNMTDENGKPYDSEDSDFEDDDDTDSDKDKDKASDSSKDVDFDKVLSDVKSALKKVMNGDPKNMLKDLSKLSEGLVKSKD